MGAERIRATDDGPRISRRPYGWLGEFGAMASPCEVHVVGAGREAAQALVSLIAAEAHRIEAKFSRYLTGNIVDRINRASGAAIEVDDETAKLLSYADELYRLSDGRFDITSGVLRRAWRFGADAHAPDPAKIEELLRIVGWHRASWTPPRLRLQPGMEIDFGGIGKEYAVDCAARIASAAGANCLINFGGDLLAQGPGIEAGGWSIGIEGITSAHVPAKRIRLTSGAIATSGDAYRHIIVGGKRLGHILDPRTGWPIDGAPRSVTVAAGSCTEAGMLATLAILHGPGAEDFLRAQHARFWCLR